MKTIPLTRGLHAIVDDSDYEYLVRYKWHARKSGNLFYAARNLPWAVRRIGIKNRTVFMHRQILGIEKGVEVDHANRNSLDNRRENLRAATRAQNVQNRSAIKGKHIPKGVDVHKGKWRARIKGRHIGYFNTQSEAEAAYMSKAIEIYGEFAGH